VKLGRGPVLGTTRRGGVGGAGGGVEGAAGLAATGAAAGVGFGAAGVEMTGGAGAAGAGVGAAGCCLLIIAFRTSPGLEMCERSILVLISPGSERAARAAELVAGWVA